MAVLKQRLLRKNASGGYDTIHLEVSFDNIVGNLTSTQIEYIRNQIGGGSTTPALFFSGTLRELGMSSTIPGTLTKKAVYIELTFPDVDATTHTLTPGNSWTYSNRGTFRFESDGVTITPVDVMNYIIDAINCKAYG